MAINLDRTVTLRQVAQLMARSARAQQDPTALAPHWGGEEYDNIGRWLALRRNGLVYGVRIPKHAYSTRPQCVKTDSNYGLVCEPSTNSVAGRDDYAGVGPFFYRRANVDVDADGAAHVRALEGDSMFAADGSNGDVFTVCPTLYWRWEETEESCLLRVTDTPQQGFQPQPGAKMPDGSVRPFMVYACYGGSGSGTEYASASGKPVRLLDVSQNKSIDLAAAKGPGYSCKTHADDWYVKAMFLLKYATKSSQAVMMGCTDYSWQYAPAIAETGVKRVVLAKAQAASVLVGSAVMLGNKGENSSTDRGNAYIHDVFSSALVTKVEPLDEATSAVYVDVAEPFDTATDQLLSSAPWQTGACDRVQGSDGSPTSCTSGKEPFKIQGIELMYGCYEVVANITLDAREAADGSLREDVHICYDSAKLSKSELTPDYVDTGVTLGTAASEGWVYQADVANVGGALLGVGVGTSTSTGTGDGTYQNVAASKGYREFLGFGDLWHGLTAGLFCVLGHHGLSVAWWYIGGRLSGVGRSAA